MHLPTPDAVRTITRRSHGAADFTVLLPGLHVEHCGKAIDSRPMSGAGKGYPGLPGLPHLRALQPKPCTTTTRWSRWARQLKGSCACVARELQSSAYSHHRPSPVPSDCNLCKRPQAASRTPHNLQADTSAGPDLMQVQRRAPARHAFKLPALPLAATASPDPTSSPPFRGDAPETQQQLQPQPMRNNPAGTRPTSNDPNRGYTW